MRKLTLLLLLVPFAASAQQPKTIDITARANPWQFTPSSFSVSVGDVVTLNITVSPNDASPDGHGFLMQTYVENGVTIPKGQTAHVIFTATTPGTFAFVCTVASCGVGHSSMFGQMIVNGVVADPNPSISGVSPGTGPTSGGTMVTIAGNGFVSPSTVTFGGAAARDVTVVSLTAITAVTPLGPANEQVALPVDVVVRTPFGTGTRAAAFTYFVPPLAISSIAPASGTAGTVVTVTGAGFTSALASSVTFGGVAATNVVIVDAVTMRATVPAHAGGVVDVIVRVGGTSVPKARSFTFADTRRRAVRH